MLAYVGLFFIGLSLIVQGLMTININFFVLPVLDRKIGPVRTNQIGSAIVAIVSHWCHLTRVIDNFSELFRYANRECFRWETGSIVDRVVTHDGHAYIRQHISLYEHFRYGTARAKWSSNDLLTLMLQITNSVTKDRLGSANGLGQSTAVSLILIPSIMLQTHRLFGWRH